MTTTIIFASSLFLTATLVFFKAIELKFGKRNLVLELLGKLDSQSAKIIGAVKFRCLQAIQTVRYIILVQTKEAVKGFLRKAEERIIEEYRARQNALMGHREIAANGSVSFYLKKITEHKGATRGKIEESL